MLDRRNEPKLLSCEDIEDIIKLQQNFSKKERTKNAEALKNINDMIKNNECSAYLVFDILFTFCFISFISGSLVQAIECL